MHLPRRPYRGEDALHDLRRAKRVARSIEAEHGHRDPRQMRVAELIRLAPRLKRIREEQESIGGETVGGEHRAGAAAHRATTDHERAGIASKFRTRAIDDGSESPHQRRHRIWS